MNSKGASTSKATSPHKQLPRAVIVSASLEGSAGQRRAQQLLHELRVRLPARRLHHLPDEEAENAFLAGAELGHLRRMPRDDVGDGRVERAAVAHLGEPL